MKVSYNFQTESDCEVILALYKEKGVDFIDEMNGIFGFAFMMLKKMNILSHRDHMGIIPLYMGWDKNGTFYVASELKALEGCVQKLNFSSGTLFI